MTKILIHLNYLGFIIDMHISLRPSKCATRVTIIFVDIPSFRSNKAISRIKALIKAARGRSLARVRARQLIALCHCSRLHSRLFPSSICAAGLLQSDKANTAGWQLPRDFIDS